MKDTIRNQEKLTKLQVQVHICGKGTTHGKKKVVHRMAKTDDKKLQFSVRGRPLARAASAIKRWRLASCQVRIAS